MVTSRTMLQSEMMFYVSSDPAVGNDANDGTSPAAPKRTIQNMMDTWHRQYDQAGYRMQVQLMDSAFTYDGFSCRGGHVGHYGYPSLPPSLQVIGNGANRALTHIRGIGGTAVEQLVWGSLHLDNVMVSSDVGSAIASRLTGSEIVTHNLAIGDCGAAALYCEANANILIGQDIDVVGNSPEFIYANECGVIKSIGGMTIRIHGARTFSDFFIGAARNGIVNTVGMNFSLAAGGSVSNTGVRWAFLKGGGIDTVGRVGDVMLAGFGRPGENRGSGGFCG